jgi:hypothetical protein
VVDLEVSDRGVTSRVKAGGEGAKQRGGKNEVVVVVVVGNGRVIGDGPGGLSEAVWEEL